MSYGQTDDGGGAGLCAEMEDQAALCLNSELRLARISPIEQFIACCRRKEGFGTLSIKGEARHADPQDPARAWKQCLLHSLDNALHDHLRPRPVGLREQQGKLIN